MDWELQPLPKCVRDHLLEGVVTALKGPVTDVVQNFQELLKYISLVREAFGGTYGIWSAVQDSLGSYVGTPDGGVKSYRDFCSEIIDDQKYVWFLRLIDFFKDFEKLPRLNPRDFWNPLDVLLLKENRTGSTMSAKGVTMDICSASRQLTFELNSC